MLSTAPRMAGEGVGEAVADGENVGEGEGEGDGEGVMVMETLCSGLVVAELG